jgi:large subunit ribosomal protein L4
MKAPLYKQDGTENGTVNLPKDIFQVEVSEGLLHEAVVRHLANKRLALAFAKTRSDVSGGGRKPWRQKGTGRARQGTIRAPHWRGGGAVFGPTGLENHAKDMPKKMRRKALFGALSTKAKAKDVLVLEEYKLDKPKTREFANLLAKLPVGRRLLVVTAGKDAIIEKSLSNIPNVEYVHANFLNVHDILKAEKILFLKEAISKTEEIFLGKK